MIITYFINEKIKIKSRKELLYNRWLELKYKFLVEEGS